MPDANAHGSSSPAQKPCPICGKQAVAQFRPFCSSRCADVDLNRWLKGGYVIPGPALGEADEEPRKAPARSDEER